MFGEIGSGHSGGLPRENPRGGSRPSLSWLPSAFELQFYPSHRTSRTRSNSLKTNNGRRVYPSQVREDDFLGFRSLSGEKIHSPFFIAPIRSKLARGGTAQESRSRWLAHLSR